MLSGLHVLFYCSVGPLSENVWESLIQITKLLNSTKHQMKYIIPEKNDVIWDGQHNVTQA